MAPTPCPVDCTCHTSPYAPCNEPGGCRLTGCGRTEPNCAVCRKRDRDTGLVCEPCRRWLPTALASIPGLAARLRDELMPALTTDDWSRDPIACRWDLAAGPAPSIAPDMIVTGGGGEAPVPIDLHIHDLLGDVIRDGGRPIDATGDNWIPASSLTPVTVNHTHFEAHDRREEHDDGTVTLHRDFRHVRQRFTVMDRRPRRDANGHKVMVPAGDQIGEVPVAQVLDQEVRAWIDAGAPGSRYRPTPTIPHLVDWLARRLDWACDHYPGIDAFAAALQQVRGQMMGALDDFDAEAEQCDGVPCNRCDLRMLFRRKDGTGDVECQNPDCLKVFTAEQYREWATHIGGQERSQRDPAEVAELLRSRAGRTADLRRV